MSEQPHEWNLSRVLDTSKTSFAQHLQDIQSSVSDFTKWEPMLSDLSEEKFSKLIAEYRSISEQMALVMDYASFRVDQNTNDQEARSMLSQAKTVCTECWNSIRFFSHWWKELDDEPASRFAPLLGPDRYVFEYSRLLRKHSLPIEQEKILSSKDVFGAQALVGLHDMVEARQVYELRLGEEILKLTDEELRTKFSDSDPAVRKAAYECFFSSRTHDREILAEIYRNVVADWTMEQRLRKYDSPISVRNAQNDLPDDVVRAHLDACEQSYSLWHRFFVAKSKVLGMKLSRTDLFAPVAGMNAMYTYDQAMEFSLRAYEGFSPRMHALASEVFSGGYVDVFPRKGKRSGGYCASVTPSMPPYLLLNFTGSLREVFTVAHEIGHAIHAQLGRKHTILSWGHAIPIAETASTFSELLVAETMFSTATKQERLAILSFLLDELFASIGRQASYTLFEIDVHDRIEKGLSTDDLCLLWREHATRLLGPDIPLPEMFGDEWLAIGHFVRYPFYCYGYSFGCLLSLALLEEYRADSKSFVPRYEAFLSAAKTASPKQLCAILGVDISDSAFWKKGFASIERMIAELESLVA